MSDIGEVCAKTLKAFEPFCQLKRSELLGPKAEVKGKCFQVVGFDIFLDSKGRPWVLEINETPSFNINLCKEGPKGLLKEPSEIDRHIKTMVLGDAISYMRKSSRLGCYTQICPAYEELSLMG